MYSFGIQFWFLFLCQALNVVNVTRIKLLSRVSTKGCCFDKDKDGWSFKILGKKCLESWVYGIALGKKGRKWHVRWVIGRVMSQMECTFLERGDGSITLKAVGE